MLHQYTQNDVNREPKLLKKWVTKKNNENIKLEFKKSQSQDLKNPERKV